MADSNLKTSVEEVDELKKRIQIEVPEATVKAALDGAYQSLRQRVRLKGFRPGKAPREVLERLYGQRLRGEVVEDLVRSAYGHAVDQHKLQPAGNPDIVVEPLDESSVLRFSATVEVYPEVDVANYEGIEVSRPDVNVEDADVDRTLDRMREAAAQVHPVDRDLVEAGDVVTANVTTVVDGKNVGEVPRRDVLIEAGAGGFSGGLEEKLVGLSKGSTTTHEVTYPDDHKSGFAGKVVNFTVTVTGIGRKEVPTIDDDFAKSYGQCDSLEALRENIRADLERHAQREADAAVRDAVLQALIERHPFDAPEALVERRCDALLNSLDIKIPPGAERQKTLATLREELRPRAVRDGKASILLDRLAEQRGLVVGDAEVDERIDKIADSAGQARERARGIYATEERRAALRAQILREKALDLVVDRSKILTVEKR